MAFRLSGAAAALGLWAAVGLAEPPSACTAGADDVSCAAGASRGVAEGAFGARSSPGVLLLQLSHIDPASAAQRQVHLHGQAEASLQRAVFTGQIRAWHGLCLDAHQRSLQGGWVHMWACEDHPNQIWVHDNATGLIRNRYGICLEVAHPRANGSNVYMSHCDASSRKQQWLFNPALRQIRAKYGECLDSPNRDINGGHVHLWTCETGNINQQWVLRPLETAPTTPAPSPTPPATPAPVPSPVATSTTPTLAPSPAPTTPLAPASTTPTAAPAPMPTTTSSPAPTRSPAPEALAPVRNCYLAPILADADCKRLEVREGEAFGLNEFQQETTGKTACLERMRARGGDSFVYSVGRCEVFRCVSKEALHTSAGANPEVTRVSLKSYTGKYLAAAQDGTLAFSCSTVEPESRFYLTENEDGTISLRSLFGRFVTARPDGQVLARAEQPDDWEKFELLRNGDGSVSLRSFHSTLLLAAEDGAASAGSGARPVASAARLELTNHSAAQAAPAPAGEGAQAWVFSELCEYQEPLGGWQGRERRSPVFVKLWEWNFDDVARECTEYLGPNGFDAVQISPVTEHVLGTQWWTKYQPVSYGLDSRSGSADDFRRMVASCRAAGVQVVVDVILNHMASACREAKGASTGTPCRGWNGTHYGSRRTAGARGWDRAGPELFHHTSESQQENCVVGPSTGWLCGSPSLADCSCCACDMYGGLPDWRTELPTVQEIHARHLEELHRMGVTMLRIDAAIYTEVRDLGAIINRMPWDYVFQEWWGEYPDAERTRVVGHYRDVAYRWKVCNALAVRPVSEFEEVLQVRSGVHGVAAEQSFYPILYHDGRSKDADKATATYKNGLAYHQQQKFFLASPFGVSVGLWGGFGWRSKEDGPPGCASGHDRCTPSPVFDADGNAQCMPTPTQTPLPRQQARLRSWVCEHRWAGVAGLVAFRKACRGLPISKEWTSRSPGVGQGRLAFRLSTSCFVALVRGHNTASEASLQPLGDWPMAGLSTGLPPGRYCDLASLETRKGWDQTSCPREVLLGEHGRVLNGTVLQGDLLAIHVGARLP